MNRSAKIRIFAALFGALLGIAAPAQAAIPKHLAPAVQALNKGKVDAAIRHLLPLAKAGDTEAQFMLVSVYQGRDEQQASHWLRKAADNRHPSAAHILGLMYLEGSGVPTDLVTAIKWLQVAAEGGIHAAQLQLGMLYRNGPNAIQDDHQAAHWIGKAAHAGLAEAQFQFAQLYCYGYGVSADHLNMKTWLQRAAEQGHPQARAELAR